MRIFVAQVDDQAQGHLVVWQVIKEGTTSGTAGHVVERPTNAVHDFAGLVFGWIDGPKLFDANAVVLSAAIGIEFKLVNQLLAQSDLGSPRRRSCTCRAVRSRGCSCLFAHLPY